MMNLQLFAADKDDFSAVKGSRLFIFEKFEQDGTFDVSTSEVLGVRTTSDKGGSVNKVESTTIKDISDKNVLGTQGATEVSYTFALSDATLEKQLSFVKKEVWIYEEIEDTSQLDSPTTKVGKGILMKVELGGLKVTGQTSGNLREFTQEGTMVSDDYYFSTVSDGTISGYKGANTGVAFTIPEEDKKLA